MASPETEIGVAYAAGKTAANDGSLRNSNPFVLDGTALVLVQFQAWNQGFDDQVKANVNAGLYQQDDPPAIRKAIVTLTNAQVAALFSSPAPLIPGVPGKIILVEDVLIRKPAGIAWTTTGSGQLALQYDASPFTNQFNLFDQATTTAFFGAAAAVWIAEQGKGQFAGIGDSSPTNNMVGAGVRLKLITADITVGTGGLTVTIYYRLWPGF